MSESAIRIIKRMPPRWIAPFLPSLRAVNRSCRHARRTYYGWQDQWRLQQTGVEMIPPARLRDRVHGVPDIKRFLTSGQRTRERIEQALLRIDRRLASFERVLDFGCGCGRTLRWLEPYHEKCRFYGTDIDSEAVAWCRTNIPFVEFGVNQALPPLAYKADMFDLIYSISVLTHLDEPHQFQWLEELRRVAKPSGILLISIQGEGSWSALNRNDLAQLKAEGFIYIRTDRWKGILPDWYQNAYHTPDYLREHFSRCFQVVEYIPRGLTQYQDIAVLRKADAS